MTKCLVCDGSDFEVSDGARICKECGAHELNFLELEFDEESWAVNPGSHFKSLQIQKEDSDSCAATGTEIFMQNWSTFEAMNIILLNWVKALRHKGASEKLKDSAFKLWIAYLKKRRIAFRSTLDEPPDFPQDSAGEVLSIRDANVLRKANVVQCKTVRKRKRTVAVSKLERIKRKVELNKLRNSTSQSPAMFAYLSEQLNNTINAEAATKPFMVEDDMIADKSIYERSYVEDPLICDNGETIENNDLSVLGEEKDDKTNLNNSESIIKIKSSVNRIILGENSHLFRRRLHLNPTFFTIEKLLSLLYISILISGENILLSDLLRWCREGHVPYFTAANLLSEDFEMSKIEYDTFFKCHLLTAHGCRDSAGMLANFLSIQYLPLPSVQMVIDKFIEALNLPKQLSTRVTKIAAKLFGTSHVRNTVPSIEVYCAALIIFTLKIAFGLDGQHEFLLSEFAENYNMMMENKEYAYRIFSWCEWQSYINRLQWWLSEVDVTRNHNINSYTSTDTQRLSQHFWTQMIWQNAISEDELNSWEVELADNLLKIGDSHMENKLRQDPLFDPCLIPYTGQIKQYVNEAYKRDPSSRMKDFLQNAQMLDKINFADHQIFLKEKELEAQFKSVLKRNVKVGFVSLSDKRRITQLLAEERKSKLMNDSAFILLLPDPLKMFWVLNKEVTTKTYGSSTIFQKSNFMWLVKLFSELCETAERDIIDYYRIIERRYFQYYYSNK